MLFQSNRIGLRKFRPKKPTTFCLPGFHADPVWQRTQAEYIEQMISLVRQYLLACRADPFYGVYLSEIDYLKPYLDLYPEERAWIARLIQQERCASGGSYNQPNETTIAGEALIRNILIGRRFHKTMMDYEPPVYMAWDVFGHIPQLPQILQGCGMEAVVFTRSNYRDPSIAIPGIPDLFLWNAPNGSSVYARRIDYYLSQDISLREHARKKWEQCQKEFPNLPVDLIIDAADMTDPRISILDHGRELADQDPALILSGAAAAKYFSCVHTLASAKKISLTPSTRDLSQYNEGCELTRSDLKLANRLLESRLYEAELWGSIALMNGIDYPSEELDYAWRQLLFCQHHDGITGCSTDIALADLLDIYREALELAGQCLQSTLEQLAEQISIPPERCDTSVLLFNSLPWLREDVVQHWIDIDGDIEPMELINEEGEPIPYEIERAEAKSDGSGSRVLAVWAEANLPATGYVRRDFIKQDEIEIPFLMETQRQSWIENEFLRVEVDPGRGGGIVSLVDKESGKEFINTKHNQPANNVIRLTEGPGDEPAWRLLTTGEKTYGSEAPAEITTLNGPMSSRLIIRAVGPGPCSRIQEIRLFRGIPYVDCRTILEDYHGHEIKCNAGNPSAPRDLYVVGFPLDLPGALPILEDRFYAKAYRRSRKNLDFHSSFLKWDSEHAMNSCYRWVDVSWSLLCRFTNGKAEQGNLAIGPAEIVTSRDRCGELRQRLMMHLARHGVTCSSRYDTDEPGADFLFRSCSFSLGAAEENAYTNNLIQRNAKAREYYERNMEEFGFVTMAVGDQRNGRERPVFILAGKSEALIKQIIEDLIQSTIAHRWEMPQTACFLSRVESVEDYGLALLNKGNCLVSLEEDGTLASALMHTAPYPNQQTQWPFDFAEQKNHVFQYRLIPHQGDWRHAEIPRRAMEYNHDPIAMPASPHDGPLPTHASYISVEPNNLLISCMKPAGFPEAEHASTQRSKPSFIIRLYETHGEESNVWLESTRAVKAVKAVRINEQTLDKKRDIFREEQFIRTVAHANEILTMQVDFAQEKKSQIQSESPPPPSSPIIVPARYWRHNSGAAPQGFFPVTLSLRGAVRTRYPEEKISIHPMELVLTNNSPHKTFQGSADILTSPNWRSIPSQFPYRLDPGSFQILPFQVLFEGEEREGFIKARIPYESFMIEDLVQIGPIPEFDIAMTLTRESFNIHLTNENHYPISGSVKLITPIEAWPAQAVGDYSLSSFSPRQQSFCIESKKETNLEFFLTDPPNRFGASSDHHWMIVKLETHNGLRYYHVRMDGRSSEGLGRIICPPYEPFDLEAEM
ncbi:MAG: hypothetical protein JXR73_15150 [Candidatus Omnitrophica bacterium]|nr:hypothetical protein [Candidatus Omnitrophota bacterium]